MLDRSLQESEALISDSNGQDTPSPSNAKPTQSAAKSSEGIGPTSRSTRTSETSPEVRLFNPYRSQTAPGEWVEGFKEDTVHDALTASEPPKGRPLVLTSCVEASPAKTSPLQVSEPDSQESEVDSSLRQPESLTLFSETEAGFSLRMFPDSFPHKAEEISESFLRRFANSGFWTELGECWTADTSECRSDGGVSSSLPDVLEADVPPRFYLSQKAAAGILRRAEKRAKTLPEHLESALRELSEAVETEVIPNSTVTEPTSPTRSRPQPETTHAPMPVRRLTPTECERLQGFPDGWTVP